MKTFLITYDLTKPESSPEYVKLISMIKELGAWAKTSKSVWLVKTNLSSKQILDTLLTTIDSNDKLIVIGVDNDWWTYGLSDEVINWMRQGL